MELFSSRKAAADAAGISKDTWRRVEEGLEVWDTKLAQIDRALGWSTGSCVAIAEGGEPTLAGTPAAHNGTAAAAPTGRLSAEAVRRAAFQAARKKLPMAAVGDIDAFSDEMVEVLRRAGEVLEDD